MHTYSTYIHTYIPTYIRTYTHTYICTYIPTHIPTYIRTYIQMYIHTYIHTYLFTYIHTYVCTYIHIYVRMYIHTHTQTQVPYTPQIQNSVQVTLSCAISHHSTKHAEQVEYYILCIHKQQSIFPLNLLHIADNKIISHFKHQKFTRKIQRRAYPSTLLMLL